MLELRRYCRLNLIPWQSCGQHRQRIVQIDHGVNSVAEKVHWLHLQIPQKVTLNLTFLEGIGAHKMSKKLVFMQVFGVLQGRLFTVSAQWQQFGVRVGRRYQINVRSQSSDRFARHQTATRRTEVFFHHSG
jgi:hypothetical protein